MEATAPHILVNPDLDDEFLLEDIQSQIIHCAQLSHKKTIAEINKCLAEICWSKNTEELLALVRNTQSDDIIKRIINRFGVSESVAKQVYCMRLSKICQLDLIQSESRLAKLHANQREYELIETSPAYQKEIISDIISTTNTLPKDRRCLLLAML